MCFITAVMSPLIGVGIFFGVLYVCMYVYKYVCIFLSKKLYRMCSDFEV